VCVTDAGYIDAAIDLADRGVIVATFGDMVKVRGSRESLAECRARGGRVEACYSPSVAIDLARSNPDKQVVFLAIGFETTVAPVVSIIPLAEKNSVSNISLLTAFKLVPPALDVLVADPELRIDAFLCPAHVSAIIGSRPYEAFVEKHPIPCVIAGFEPLDILYGIEGILKQILEGKARVENQYNRVVKRDGNRRARQITDRYLAPADAVWRGLGRVPQSGLELRPAFSRYDAREKHGIQIKDGSVDPKCRCGEVIKGKIKPMECALFGRACAPLHPIGPCMVSEEGSCAAYYKFNR
jgi:hydrogenase expression/formation protein HypD